MFTLNFTLLELELFFIGSFFEVHYTLKCTTITFIFNNLLFMVQ